MKVIQIGIPDDLRDDIRIQIKNAILSSPIVRKIINNRDILGEIEDARKSSRTLDVRLAKIFTDSAEIQK